MPLQVALEPRRGPHEWAFKCHLNRIRRRAPALHAPLEVAGASYENMLLATKNRFAGRSARRRMYHGNQCEP